MFIQGKARRVGDNVNTDQMYPTRYTSIVEDSEMAKHCMEDYDPDLIKRMDPGDVLVAGVGFGCGISFCHRVSLCYRVQPGQRIGAGYGVCLFLSLSGCGGIVSCRLVAATGSYGQCHGYGR